MSTQRKPKKEFVRSPKGMHDLLPIDFRYVEYILSTGRDIAEYYGFQPIETPHVEQTDYAKTQSFYLILQHEKIEILLEDFQYLKLGLSFQIF